MAIRTYKLSVPLEQYDSYTHNGWTFVGMDNDAPGYGIVQREVPLAIPEDSQVIIPHPMPPSHIQRASIRRPLGKYRDARFFDSISLDHMNGPGFSFDALPESLRRMHLTSFAYETFKAENLFLTKDGRSYALRLYTRLRGQELDQYVNWLIELRDNQRKTSRPTAFTKKTFGDGELPHGVDLWWDVVNDVIFSFDKNYMTRMPEYLRISFSMMEGTYAGNSLLRNS